MNQLLLSLLIFGATNAQAATILQTKAKSAIIEATDSEMDGLKLAAGQNVQFTANGNPVQANIVKVIKNKLLVKTDTDLTGLQGAAVELSTPLAAPAVTNTPPPAVETPAVTTPKPARKVMPKDNSNVYKNAAPKKPWIAGVNVKYVKGTSKVQFADIVPGVAGPSYNYAVTGFDLSGIGIYYFGQLGAGAEVEYASLKGSDSANSSTITQMQLSGLGEYKINPMFSAGLLITLASNYKASDNQGNDSSINGTGFGLFGTYQFNPKIRFILDYRTVNYKLDSNSVTTSDIRIGGGYYF